MTKQPTVCPVCGALVTPKGMANHMKSHRVIATGYFDYVMYYLHKIFRVWWKFVKFFLPTEFNFTALLTLPLGIILVTALHYYIYCKLFGPCGYFEEATNLIQNTFGLLSQSLNFAGNVYEGVKNLNADKSFSAIWGVIQD